MSRTLEETNKIVDRLATIAAILLVAERVNDLVKIQLGMIVPGEPTDDQLVRDADVLVNAAATYLERRDAEERRIVDMQEAGEDLTYEMETPTSEKAP
jgi:hypothetical protein